MHQQARAIGRRMIPVRPAGRFAARCLLAFCLCAGPLSAAPSPRFPSSAVWHQNIAAAPLHPDSASMIATLQSLGGWGNSNRMQIDFSLHLRQIAEGEIVPSYPVVQSEAWNDYTLPDCEPLGSEVPLPSDAAFEGQSGLSCPNGDEDCHLLITSNGLLYELYGANFNGSEIDALCLAVWDLSRVYPAQGRGEHCTSSDAAGFPIAALMPNADGVAAAMALPDGDLGHAIRFILPNDHMANDVSLGGRYGRLYVRPASHAGGPSGPAGSVPYGARLRLRADFDLSGYNAAAQVILRTMQRYGIVLADGGNIALTFESDRHTENDWNSLGITPQIFWNGSTGNRTPLQVTDFSVIDTGARIAESYECARTVLPASPLFANGFE